MNYSTLKSSIADFLLRQDLTAVIPTFIELAETALNRSIRHRRMIARATNNFDEHFLELPDDFLEAKNVQINSDPVGTLKYVTLEHADLLRSNRYRSPGQPQYYTIVGNTLESTPIPDGDYQVELTYYTKLPVLTDLQPSNWLIATHPDLYLYGALLHSAPYLKNDERVPVWDGLYQRTVRDVNADSERSELSGATLQARTFIW